MRSIWLLFAAMLQPVDSNGAFHPAYSQTFRGEIPLASLEEVIGKGFHCGADGEGSIGSAEFISLHYRYARTLFDLNATTNQKGHLRRIWIHLPPLMIRRPTAPTPSDAEFEEERRLQDRSDALIKKLTDIRGWIGARTY